MNVFAGRNNNTTDINVLTITNLSTCLPIHGAERGGLGCSLEMFVGDGVSSLNIKDIH